MFRTYFASGRRQLQVSQEQSARFGAVLCTGWTHWIQPRWSCSSAPKYQLGRRQTKIKKIVSTSLMKNIRQLFTLQIVSMSEMALRPMLAATMMSSCLPLFPAATALAVAWVMGLAQRTRSSGLTLILGGSFDCRAWTPRNCLIYIFLVGKCDYWPWFLGRWLRSWPRGLWCLGSVRPPRPWRSSAGT